MSDARAETGGAPERAGLVLITLILVAAVANLNLAVANVALPDIGEAFDASQTELNLVAVGYSLGLAASVLYFGAVGDRYGRKLMLVLGTCSRSRPRCSRRSRRRSRCCSPPACSVVSPRAWRSRRRSL
jgi:MFS transporter, DHA2 family, multidrug resistance protein